MAQPQYPSGAAARAAAPSTTIGDLPDDVLVRCLAPLSQEERFEHAALVCKRWQQACLTPSLLQNIFVGISSEASSDASRARLAALLRFLQQHAAYVRGLSLRDFPSEDAQAAALVAACLEACGAAGSLEWLVANLGWSLPAMDWLCGLTKLRQLKLVTLGNALTLPAGVSGLTALAFASLKAGRYGSESALPPNLTRLLLSANYDEQLPVQVAALNSLDTLELDMIGLAGDSLAPLARLPALRSLMWESYWALPASVSALTQLQSVQAVGLGDPHNLAAAQAALPHLRGLTALSLSANDGTSGCISSIVASLPRLQWLQVSGPVGVLTPGPWLATLRSLGMPWGVLVENARLLRGATRLECLDSLNEPREGWAAVCSLLEALPALRCFSIKEADEVPSARPALGPGAKAAIERVKRLRPGLSLQWASGATL